MSDVKLDPPWGAPSITELCQLNRRLGRQDALREVADLLYQMLERSPLAIAERIVRQMANEEGPKVAP